jgi:aryl carrier-like protein
MMELVSKGKLKPIQLAKVSSAAAIQETFRFMQKGSHIGKIVLEIRDSAGNPQLGGTKTGRQIPMKLDSSASYLLIGGLGGLGRSISVYMVQHGARNLTFLSRNAGNGDHDQDFVHELESMGCAVQLVRGSVTNPEDVILAVEGTVAPLKGIIQMSMVLRDQAFSRMTIDEWDSATQPKVQGTWNLHNVTQAHGLDLDFFILFSSLSGILGQPGQANYAAANTFLDAFVQYRTSMNLPCTAIDIGAVEDAGYLFENEYLLRKLQGTGWRAVQESELLEALGAAMSPRQSKRQSERSTSNLIEGNNFLLGIAPTVPLSSPNSSVRMRKDVRMAVYHNTGSETIQSGPSSDILRVFLATAKKNPPIFKEPETAALIAREMGKKLYNLLLKTDEEVNISLSLTELGMDSIVAVEMRAWWKLTFGFDVSVLEMLGMGTLEALGKRAAEGLLAIHDA